MTREQEGPRYITSPDAMRVHHGPTEPRTIFTGAQDPQVRAEHEILRIRLDATRRRR